MFCRAGQDFYGLETFLGTAVACFFARCNPDADVWYCTSHCATASSPANCPVQPPPCHAAPLDLKGINVTCLEESGYASELLVTPHARDCLRPSLHSGSEWIILACASWPQDDWGVNRF